jgi:hypothetical protein
LVVAGHLLGFRAEDEAISREDVVEQEGHHVTLVARDRFTPSPAERQRLHLP